MHVHDKLVFEAPEAKVNWVRITSPQNMIGGVSLRTLFAGENGARCQLGTGAFAPRDGNRPEKKNALKLVEFQGIFNFFGAGCRIRTDDLPLTRRVLYQLS